MGGETLSLKVTGQRSHSHSIGFPSLILFVEIEARGRIQPKLIIRSENGTFCEDGKIFARAELIRFSGIQFSQAKDQRLVIRSLFIIKKIPIETIV